jgi:hypothetical protein
MLAALPAEWRCALVAVHPTSPLSIFVSLQLWSVANAEYRNGQAPRSCRVASASSAVMLGGLFFDRAALRAVGQSTQHHRFRFASAVVSVSARGAAAPRTGAGELHRQCFAKVGQYAVAQIWCRLAGASCWISRRLRLGLAPGMRGSCGTRPLRQSYITPHCPQCLAVAALKLRLVPVTAGAPFG